MESILESIFSAALQSPAVQMMVQSTFGEFSKLLLSTAPVNSTTNQPQPTSVHPQQTVKSLQTIVNAALAKYAPATPRLKVDGIYGAKTDAALKQLIALAGISI